MNALPMSRAERVALILAALVLLAVRLPFLPTTLEDIDSINFDLGVHEFNPLLHQPHPPGYTVYIAAAKLVHPFFSSHAMGLAFVSAVFGAATIVPLVVLMRLLIGLSAGWLASLFVVFTPLVWFNSVRPMSDTMGLFAVLSALALLLLALEHRDEDGAAADQLWNVGAVVAGLSLGIRIQAVMIVGPLLLYGWFRQKRVRKTTPVFFGLGVAVWLIPLVVLSGGPAPLWRAFLDLVRNAVPVEPLLSTLTPRALKWAVHDTAFAPWGPLKFSAPVVGSAIVGLAILARRDRRGLLLLTLLFGPYAAYTFLIQWTDTIRYALPIVPAMAVLAAIPFTRGRTLPVAFAGALYVAASIKVTGPALHAYGTMPSPSAQAVARLAAIAGAAPDDWVISGHFVYFRHLPRLPSRLHVIQPEPRVEWQRLGNYWKRGGRRPVLFLRERGRTSLLLIDQRAQHVLERWRWPDAVDRLIKGARPVDIELVRIDPPRWFADSGFLITYEAGPVARVEREPHRLFVKSDTKRRMLMVSGDVPRQMNADVRVRAGKKEIGRWAGKGKFALQLTVGPFASNDEYVPITFDASAPLRLWDVWLENSSAATVRPLEGFHMPERDEGLKLFRWMGPEATSIVMLPADAMGGRFRLRGLVPAPYFHLPVRIAFIVDGQTVGIHEVATKDFEIEQDIPASGSREQRVQIVTSQHFVPDDIERNGDRRRLSVRVYDLAVAPIIRPKELLTSPGSAPGTPGAAARTESAPPPPPSPAGT